MAFRSRIRPLLSQTLKEAAHPWFHGLHGHGTPLLHDGGNVSSSADRFRAQIRSFVHSWLALLHFLILAALRAQEAFQGEIRFHEGQILEVISKWVWEGEDKHSFVRET